MAVSTFDFDELEAVEAAARPLAAEPASAGTPQETVILVVREGVVVDADVQPQVKSVSPQAVALQHIGQVVDTHISGLRGFGRLSRARAWCEIRRFFDAEPQKHYDSPDRNEWKTYYAKELILQSACEHLQTDGFVVIDALLSPHHFAELAHQLLLEAPEQADALKDHVSGGRDPGVAAIGWVGMREQAERTLLLSEQVTAAAMARMQSGSQAAVAETAHDRALCESCLLSLAHDRESSSALRPQSKQQFFRLLRTYIHTVAANSMSESKVRPDEKIPVQFCFGNMPAPQAALLDPPCAPQRQVPLLGVDGAA